MNNLLFIDDEVDIIDSYARIFQSSREEKDYSLEDAAENFFGEGVVSLRKESDLDFKVFTALQGEEGLEIVKAQIKKKDPVCVAFIDMRMPPGINGMQTAKRIRELDPRVEIVIVTAYSDANYKEIVDTIGGADKLLYLKKPFDIQEIKQLALNLSVKYRNESIKDDFISNISHELKTPLASILGFHQLLESSQDLSTDDREYVEIIGQSAKLMKCLVDDLITTLEFKNDVIRLEKKKTDLCDLIKDVYSSFKPICDGKDTVDFKYEINCENPFYLEVDRTRIIQCLNNLISNALKFTFKGHIILGLDTDDHHVYLFVKDTGIGMKSEDLRNIFDKFSRLENDHHAIPGLGLGLSIVSKIASALGAKINVESEKDKGTKFILELPR